MVVTVGMSSLHELDLENSRNSAILALSLMMGLAVPFWLEKYPGVIDTGEYDMTLSKRVDTG